MVQVPPLGANLLLPTEALVDGKGGGDRCMLF